MREPPTLRDHVRITSGFYEGRVGRVSRVSFLMVSRLWIVTVEVDGLGQLIREPENLELTHEPQTGSAACASAVDD